MNPFGSVALLFLAILAGAEADRWVLSTYGLAPQQHLAAAMAGLFAGGLVVLLALLLRLMQRKG